MFPGLGIPVEMGSEENKKFPIETQVPQPDWQIKIRGCNHNKPIKKIVSMLSRDPSFRGKGAIEKHPTSF